MMKRWLVILSVICLLMTAYGGSLLASGENGSAHKGKMERLKQSLVQVTVSQGIVMIVKSLDLNIDPIRFVKAPKAGDYFTKVPNDAPYASAFIIAHHNGIELPKDVDPNAALTREQFVHYLIQGVRAKGEFAVIEIYINIADQEEIDPAYMESIQTALKIGIAELDKDRKFRPDAKISRRDAKKMTASARKFVREMIDANGPKTEQPPQDPNVSTSIGKVNDEVNKVTISWGEKPHAGYRVTIDKIEFTGDGKAVIHYSLRYPLIDALYAQVVTEAKAETFVSSKFDVSFKQTIVNGSPENEILPTGEKRKP